MTQRTAAKHLLLPDHVHFQHGLLETIILNFSAEFFSKSQVCCLALFGHPEH
jgi:hypothetical protein